VEWLPILKCFRCNKSSRKSSSLSRALNLALSESTVLRHCREHSIGVSAIEPLPDGGVRLVCMSSEGAADIRSTFNSKVIDGDVRREKFRPSSPLW
jgi:hypothetical protein